MSVPDWGEDYNVWLGALKQAFQRARAGLAANANMIALYWQIGRGIAERERAAPWGSAVLPRLARDLTKALGVKGFSERNLRYMRDFAEAWPDPSILQHAAAKLPWGHHQVLLDRLPDGAPMDFYVERAVEEAWTRNILIHMVEIRLHDRQGQAVTAFGRTMPPDRAQQARELFKDPYVLNFVGADRFVHERHLQESLLHGVKQLLLELGSGFAFVGENVRFVLGDKEYFLDMLFYHVELNSFVVVDLKMDEFKPEYAGKIGFYQRLVDEERGRRGTHNPTIGLVLCRGKDDLTVRYSLSAVGHPMAVSDYKVLPAPYARVLPSEEVLNEHLKPLVSRGTADGVADQPSPVLPPPGEKADDAVDKHDDGVGAGQS